MFKKVPIIFLVAFLLLGCSSSKNNSKSFVSLQIKYAKILDVPTQYISDNKLYTFIDEWINTPYKLGGDDKKGIDCSAFIQLLLKNVYNINAPRVSVAQFLSKSINSYTNTKYLAEGDLVFFKTEDNTVVSHVGMYLWNGRFVSALTNSGVSISDINTEYWKSRFVAAGRVKTP